VKPDQFFESVRRLTSTLTAMQMASLAVAFIGVVGVVAGSAYYVNTPSYSLLFSDLDAESASSVVTRLKNEKVPYVLDEGGRTVRVASNRVDELRLEFAAQGQPTSGRIGFEIFDRTAFGTTEFIEHVNYRRALEGELARTIATIAEVASARVHIAMAKDSLFTGDAQPAKATVVLKLRSNRMPSPSMVAGITGLVSASVESLRPESVIVIDTYGRSLTHEARAGSETPDGVPVEKQLQLEREVSTRVVALLEPIVGTGHVRVNVSARLDGGSEETTEERWDPTTVLRSRQSSTDTGGGLTGARGAAGARANAPPTVTTAPSAAALAATAATAGTPAAAAGALVASRTSDTSNYEVSKTVTHRIAPVGALARLSVAVVLDDDRVTAKDAAGVVKTTNKARSAADLQRIHGLVAAAVGFDAERGDQLTVENIAFGEQGLDDFTPPEGWWRRTAPQFADRVANGALDVARIGVVLGIGLVALLFVLKPMARRALRLPQAALRPAGTVTAGSLPRTVADLQNDIEAELDASIAPKGEARRVPALTRRIAKVADQEPEHLARIVRGMLAEEDAK
jgi:flagellar M-ring protein FliF